MADDYAGGNPFVIGNPFVSVCLHQLAESLNRQRQDLDAWAAAWARARSEPARGQGARRYAPRPGGVLGCTARVRTDLGEDRCGTHAESVKRRRVAGEVRRARERLHATITRMV